MNEETLKSQGLLPPRIYEYVLAGLLLAAGAGALVGYHVYHGFVLQDMSRDRAYWGIGLPFVGVVAGLYIFAYGWQRGDVAKAIRMSMWLSLGVVGIIAAVLGALAVKRSAGSSGRSFLSFGMPLRRRRTGLTFGNPNGYGYGWMGGTAVGGNDDTQQGSDLMTIHCPNCGEMFIPLPPKAICPYCGASALGNTG